MVEGLDIVALVGAVVDVEVAAGVQGAALAGASRDTEVVTPQFCSQPVRGTMNLNKIRPRMERERHPKLFPKSDKTPPQTQITTRELKLVQSGTSPSGAVEDCGEEAETR